MGCIAGVIVFAAEALYCMYIGTSGVPVQGFMALQGNDGSIRKFTLHGDKNLEIFPRAHTCFNRYVLVYVACVCLGFDCIAHTNPITFTYFFVVLGLL